MRAAPLLQHVDRLEHYRRAVRYLGAHRGHLVAASAGKGELATLDATIVEIQSAIDANATYPLDTPPPPPPSTTEQPLVMPGSEKIVLEFLETLIGEAA
jgi:hypothetical protein